jgi:hypothetical protein
MLADCIPVFFHPDSGYNWDFPQNQSSYSVYISESHVQPRELNIESQLLQISSGEIKELQKAMIQLIPGPVYAHPQKTHLQKFHDALDMAVQVLTWKSKHQDFPPKFDAHTICILKNLKSLARVRNSLED